MGDNFAELRKAVVEQLKNYNFNVQKIAALQYELKNQYAISPDEMIAALNFAHADTGMGVSAGFVSDKTADIALTYQEKAVKLGLDARKDVVTELRSITQRVSRLNYYISLLDPTQRQVIQLTYMSRKTNEEIAESMKISPRKVRTIRREALDSLCGMFDATSAFR